MSRPHVSAAVSATGSGLPLVERSAARRAALRSTALMASAVGTAVTTYVFWVVVARRDGAAAVGAASAQIATITFLGSAASLNLTNVLARFIPVAGRATGSLIAKSYLAAGAAAGLAALAFLATPWREGATAGGLPVWAFIGLVVLSAICLIQDGGLIGLGRAGIVPIENVSMGLLRLAMLPLGAALLVGSAGAVVAWGIGLTAAVVVVTVVVLGRFAPARRGEPALPARSELRSFIVIESVTTAITATLSTFLPALVTFSLGDVTGGYFYLPWMFLAIGTLLLSNNLISAVRESVAHPAAAPSILAGQLRIVAVLVAGGLTVCVATPGLPLALLGDDFAENASGLVRWLGLSLPGTAMCLLFWALALIHRRPWPTLILNLAVTASTVGVILVFGAELGLSGIGAVFCIVQTIAGLAVAPTAIKWLRMIVTTAHHDRGEQA